MDVLWTSNFGTFGFARDTEGMPKRCPPILGETHPLDAQRASMCCARSGFCPVYISNGVLLCNLQGSLRTSISDKGGRILIALAHRVVGKPESTSMHLAISTSVRFSATPLCCWVYFTVSCLLMPTSSSDSVNMLKIHSFALSERNTTIF